MDKIIETRGPIITPGDSLLVRKSSGISWDPDALVYIAEMDDPPTDARKLIINQFFLSLKLYSLFEKADILYLFASHSQQASKLNAVDPLNYEAVEVNSPTWTEDSGFTGDGSSVYIDLETALTELNKYSLNSGSVSCYCLTQTPKQSGALFGVWRSTGPTFTQLNKFNDGNTYHGINSGAGSIANFDMDALLTLTRTDATNYYLYKGASSIDTENKSTVSVPLQDFIFLARRESEGGILYPTDAKLAFAFIGEGLSGDDISNLNTIVGAYLTSVGAI